MEETEVRIELVCMVGSVSDIIKNKKKSPEIFKSFDINYNSNMMIMNCLVDFPTPQNIFEHFLYSQV